MGLNVKTSDSYIRHISSFSGLASSDKFQTHQQIAEKCKTIMIQTERTE